MPKDNNLRQQEITIEIIKIRKEYQVNFGFGNQFFTLEYGGTKQDMSLDKRVNEYWNEHDADHFYKEELLDFVKEIYSLGKQEGLQEAVACAEKMKEDFADREKELVEEIKKLEKVYTASTLVFTMIDPAAVDGYNLALEDVLAIIEKK